MITTTAAVCRGESKPMEIEEIQIESPRDDEVIVRVVSSGICHTDMICRDQWFPVPLPSVLGHEGAGVVEAVGRAVSKVAVGDHVVLTFLSCGSCRSCLRAEPAYCDQLYGLNFGGARADGTTALSSDSGPVHGHFFGQSSFATYALASERNVVKVDPEVDLKLLGPLGCGVQTGFGATLNSLRPAGGSSIVIFGTGSVGLSALMGAEIVGCATIIAVDLKPERLEMARRLGATHTINPADADTVEAIREITGGGADYSLETTANPAVFREAVDCLGQKGTCGLIGAAALGTQATFDMNTILLGGRRIVGIVEGDSIPDLFIPTMVRLIKQGRFRFEELVSYYPLSQVNQACEDSLSGAAIKPVLVP